MNYTTSKDYEELWRLVQEGKEIIGIREERIKSTIEKDNGKFCIKEKFDWHVSKTKKGFIDECRRLNLEFLPPDAWIKIESDKDLPPVGMSVQCVYRGYQVGQGTWEKDLNKWDFCDSYIDKDKITHWKPLPKAPEVEA